MSAVPQTSGDGLEKKQLRKGGLSHLVSKAKSQVQGEERKLKDVPLDKITVLGGFNPRKRFDPEALDTLANSIISKGVRIPVLVREEEGGEHVLIDGERRFRAAKLARERGHPIETLPCIVFSGDIDDREALYIALVTGHNERLGPFEEASVFVRLRDEGVSVEEIARQTGYAEPFVFERLRLATMPEAVKDAVTVGEISLNQAKRMHQENEGNHEAMLRALHVAKGNKPTRGRPKGSKNKPKTAEQVSVSISPASEGQSPALSSGAFTGSSLSTLPPINCRNCAPNGFDPSSEKCLECEDNQQQRTEGGKADLGKRPKGAKAAFKALEEEFEKQVEKLAGLIEFSGLENDLRQMSERLQPYHALCRKALAEEMDTDVSLAVRKREHMFLGMTLLLRTVMHDGK